MSNKRLFEEEIDNYCINYQRKPFDDNFEEELDCVTYIIESSEDILSKNKGLSHEEQKWIGKKINYLGIMCIEIGMRHQFREKFWISEDAFGYILNIICWFIEKTLTSGSYFYIYFYIYFYFMYILYFDLLAECFNILFSKQLATLCSSSINTSADKLVSLLVQVLAFLFF